MQFITLWANYRMGTVRCDKNREHVRSDTTRREHQMYIYVPLPRKKVRATKISIMLS